MGIPADARVDPARFPEEEFPLCCPNCDYLLRGLTSQRCPECGREFEAGRLLVEQYVLEGGARVLKRTVKRAKWIMMIGIGLGTVPMICMGLVATILSFLGSTGQAAGRIMDWFDALSPFLMVIMGVGVVLLFGSMIPYARMNFIMQKKRTQVFKGIDRTTPSFKAAQRYLWISPIMAVAIFLTVGIWQTEGCSAWLDYYAATPSRILLPLAGALGVGLLLLAGRWLLRRSAEVHSGDDDQR